MSKIETLNARIEKNVAAVADLNSKIEADRAEVATLEALANVGAGSLIEFERGPKDVRETVVARVLGVQDTDKGRVVKAYFGEGFSAETAILPVGKITRVVPEVVPTDEGGEAAATDAAA
jgi:hypothetical protein